VTDPSGDAAAQRRDDRAEAKVLRDDLATDAHSRREDLARAARELKKEVADLRGEVNNLNTRTQRAEKATFRSAVVIGFLLLIVVVVGVLGVQLYGVVNDQKRQNERVWCPFYSLILGGYAPESRELNPDGSYEGSARQRYVDGFEGPHGIRAQYGELHCTAPLIPPRAES
jgi:hypothetical protein